MTLQERKLTTLMRWWVGLFAAATVGFAIFPQKIIYWMNVIGYTIFKWPVRMMPNSSESFWNIMSVSLLVVLTYMAYMAQKDIRQNLGYVKVIIISKLVTSVGFLLALIFSEAYFGYLVGLVVDFTLFLITIFYYHRTEVSRGL